MTSLVAAALLATLSAETAWRVLFVIGAAPLLIALIATRTLPESPRYLLRRGRVAEAEAIVRRMEQSAGIPPDWPVDQEEPGFEVGEPDLGRTQLSEIFSARYLGRTVMAWVLWFTVFYVLLGGTIWMPSLYVRVAGVAPSTASLLGGAVTLVSICLIVLVGTTVDQVGRRRWFLLGYAISLVGAVLAAALGFAGHLDTWPALFVAGGLMLVGVSGIDPLVYAYTAEIYPTRMRSWGALSASSWRGFAAVLAPAVTGRILDSGTDGGAVFALFAGVLAIGLLVHARWGVETKRAPLESLSR